MAAAAMMNLNARERDEFLKALEEARRAALEDDDEAVAPRKSRATSYGSAEFLHTVDRMAGKLRSYIPTGLLSRLYSENFSRPPDQEAEAAVEPPFFTNYRPQFYFRTTDVTGVVSLPEGTEMVMPGDNVAVTIELITPIAMEEKLRFALREGGRTVGAGVVTSIIE